MAMKEMEKKKTFFDSAELGAFGSNGDFVIKVRFDNCGEWGGHFEKMKLYAKPESKIFLLDYYKTTVDCNLEESSSAYSQDTVVFKNIELSKSNERAILKYLKSLAEAKVTSRFPGHSGNYYEAEKSDSTFTIKCYDQRRSTLKIYMKLLRNLIVE